jgi:hypothetical protein
MRVCDQGQNRQVVGDWDRLQTWCTGIRFRTGLSVRILGEIHKAHADLLRRADAIFIEELRRHGLYDKVRGSEQRPV